MQATKKAWGIILLLCCAVYILSGFQRLCPNILAGYLMEDFSLNGAQLSMISGTTMLAYGLMQLPSGILADVLGGKKALIVLLVITGIGVLWFGATDSFNSAVVARFLVGLGAAVTIPCMIILASTFPAEVYGRINSLFLSTGALGGLLAASPLAFASEVFGWRLPIIFAGMLTLLLCVAVFFVLRNDEETKTIENKVSIFQLFKNIQYVLCSKQFWPLALWSGLVVSLFFLYVGLWWGPYLIRANSIDTMTASFIISLGSVVWLIGQPCIGFTSDFIKKRRIVLIVCSFLPLSAALSMLFFTGNLSVPLLLLQGILLIIGTNASTIMFTMLKESFPPHLLGTATGCANCIYPIAAALFQNLYGFILDRQLAVHEGNQAAAFTDASWVYIIPSALGIALAFMTKETYGNKPE